MYGVPACSPYHPGRSASTLTLPRLRGREGWGGRGAEDYPATRSWGFGLGGADKTVAFDAPRINSHRDRKPRTQQAGERTAGRQRNPHRAALHDLRQVAGRVVRWQATELGAAGRRETLDPAFQHL